jgi:flagellum-specific peptidoglycan hydrolase FlgJ
MYISQYKDIAMSNMKIYGIPASIILAQGILESGAGRVIYALGLIIILG